MIPVCLVTGFLGAGKTTFLQLLARRYSSRRIVFLINEFSNAPIDGKIVEIGEGGLAVVSGGSIFCRCKVTDFVGNLKNIQEAAGLAPGAEPEGVIIEASGIADPKVIRALFAETGLDSLYSISSIITVVSPGSFLKLLHTLPNIRAQVEAAHVALLNKTDLFSRTETDETEKALLEINPRVRVVRTQRCEAGIDPFVAEPELFLAGEYAKCADPNYGRLEIAVTRNVDTDKLKSFLERFGEYIYRVKGFVPTAKGIMYADYSREGFQAAPAPRKDVETCLAFIFSGSAVNLETEISRGIENGDISGE